jgi:hypothetical protein
MSRWHRLCMRQQWDRAGADNLLTDASPAGEYNPELLENMGQKGT